MLPPQGALRPRCSWRSEWSLGRRWPPRVGRASLVLRRSQKRHQTLRSSPCGRRALPTTHSAPCRAHVGTGAVTGGEAEAWPSGWHGTQTSSHPPPRDRQCLEPQCCGAGETQVGARRCSACRQGQVTPAPASAECECASVCVSGHTYSGTDGCGCSRMGVCIPECEYTCASWCVRACVTTGCRRCASEWTCLGVT